MPPILLHQWKASLVKCGETSITIYAGTPKERETLNLKADWVLVGMEIFKIDFERIYQAFENVSVTIVVDEAVSIKNPESENHRSLFDFKNENFRNAIERRKRKSQKSIAPKNRTPVLTPTAQAKKIELLQKLGIKP